MNMHTLIAASGEKLKIANRSPDGAWSMETMRQESAVNCLAVDPHHANVVYAGTQGNGVLCTDDAGKTWQSAGLEGQAVKSLEFSACEQNVIFAGTKPPAIYVSRDAGENWTELESFRQMRSRLWFTPAEPGDPYVQGLAVSPKDPNVILAGIEYGALLRSTDGGKSWHGHLKNTSRDCHSLCFHPNDGDWAYQGSGGWPAAVTRDGGTTWQQPHAGMGWSLYGWDVAADPERPEIWYVSTAPFSTFPKIWMMPTAHWDGHANASIFRFEPNGRWKKLSGGLPQPLDYMPYALLTDPQAPGHLYAGLSNGDVWHTTDYGETWDKLPVNLGAIHRSLVML